MELEAEVAKLKEENQELKKKQAEMLEMQKNQLILHPDSVQFNHVQFLMLAILSRFYFPYGNGDDECAAGSKETVLETNADWSMVKHEGIVISVVENYGTQAYSRYPYVIICWQIVHY
ncbi:uncharacterized protein LOC132800014 isoform X1 [Ziziphus jujuba]|uniref:Uncharacterized protein LOC132800014 isoform X1 n=1 Tax=Ziziphus jujuba TaxID=326968 RepID=A0ABM3ZWN2_ZIZJJ|nr:uncharacterized protein LOC132800014 isoform X1 [Ziziphus jujuba]